MFKRAPSLTLLALLALVAACARSGDKEAEEAQKAGGGERMGGGERHAEAPPEPTTMEIVVPAGTTFTIVLDQTLSSKTNHPGDPVQAHVIGGIRQEDQLVVPDGAAAKGTVAQVEGSGRVTGRAVLAMNITSIETVAGSRPVETAMVEGKIEAPGTKKRDVATIVGGTAAGAVLGEVLGDNAKLGAIVGAAAGTGVVLATKGKELTLEPGTKIDLKLVNPLTVSVPKGGPGA